MMKQNNNLPLFFCGEDPRLDPGEQTNSVSESGSSETGSTKGEAADPRVEASTEGVPRFEASTEGERPAEGCGMGGGDADKEDGAPLPI